MGATHSSVSVRARVIAEKLVREAEKVDRVVGHLLDAAASGDIAAANALVRYFDQALGKPTERVEHRVPATVEDLDEMSEEELGRLVAQGRQRRLERQGLPAVPDVSDWRRRDPSLRAGAANGGGYPSRNDASARVPQ
jgi:hypothetical protein